MKRRAFLLLGGAAAAWPRSVRSANVKRVIGFLVPGTKAAYDQYIAAFVQRLRELSWTEGENVAIVYRWTEGLKDRLAEIAAEFARLKVDVIVTSASEGVIVAKQATSAIPIVFAATSDPVAAGLVESLAHPGVNVTGLSAQWQVGRIVAGTWIATAGDPERSRRSREYGRNRKRTSSGSHRRPRTAGIGGPQCRRNRVRLRRTEEQSRCPLLRPRSVRWHQSRAHHYVGARRAVAGDLRRPELCGCRRPHILRAGHRRSVPPRLCGAKPADIPVEQPTKFYLFANRTTAKALGLTIPPSILLRADEVIE